MRHAPFTRILHWAIALLMLGLIASGWWMIDLNFYSTWYYTAPYLHKAGGVLVLVLGVILLIWKQVRRRVEEVAGHKRWEKLAAGVAHTILFAAVITIPVSGYLFTTSNGEGVSVFELFTLPALFSVSDHLRDWAIQFHIYASYGLLAVIAAHAGGALKHHIVDRDQTLRRMLF